MPTVWFCTPAHGRLDLSKVCFAEHAWAAEQLAPSGVDVVSCVVACDENLDLAKGLGFATVERANDFLGARWNDAYQYAASEGADFICPLGSDSWIHPRFFERLPKPNRTTTLTGKSYAVVDELGERIAHLEIDTSAGVGPNVVPTWLFGAADWRPVREDIQRGCDNSLLLTIQRDHDITFAWHDFDPVQYVGFRTNGEQLNPYKELAERWAVSETDQPWLELERLFPVELVDDMREVYAARRQAAG